jgi:uncharacterized membrane protein YidH (DUF202 family)
MAAPAARARRTANSPVVDRLARMGFAARGTTYLLMGWIALQIGLGHHPAERANQRGAFQELAHHSFGSVLLIAMIVGLAGYVIFRATNAIWGERGERHGLKRQAKRIGSAGRAIAYAVLAYGAWAVLEHRNSSAGVGSGAGLMKHEYGRWLVAAIGLGLVVGGLAQVVTGLMRRFRKNMKMNQMGPRTTTVVTTLGTVGTVARGVVFMTIGGFFIDAAKTYSAAEAKGLDANLRDIVRHPGGQVVLVGIGVGLMVFGLYSWCEARWRRTGKEGALTAPSPAVQIRRAVHAR